MTVYMHPMAPRREPLPLCGRCQQRPAAGEVRWPDEGRLWALVVVCDPCMTGAILVARDLSTTVEVVEYYPAEAPEDPEEYTLPAAPGMFWSPAAHK